MANERKRQALNFLIKDVYMCVYLKEVTKVLTLVALEKVPGSPPYLAGLMNIEGRNIPVIDIALRLGLTRKEKYSLDTPLLLCTNGKKEIAIIADEVLELIDVDELNIQMHEEFNKPNSLFLGSIVFHVDSSLLINMDALVDVSLTEGSKKHAIKI